jgi:hypothetical protein
MGCDVFEIGLFKPGAVEGEAIISYRNHGFENWTVWLKGTSVMVMSRRASTEPKTLLLVDTTVHEIGVHIVIVVRIHAEDHDDHLSVGVSARREKSCDMHSGLGFIEVYHRRRPVPAHPPAQLPTQNSYQ